MSKKAQCWYIITSTALSSQLEDFQTHGPAALDKEDWPKGWRTMLVL